MKYDAIVIGGSFAGQSAAMQLARARRSVLVVDARQPRNRFADASHGFLGQDGRAPAAIIEEAERQLLAYPSASLIHGEAASATVGDNGFTVALESGEAVTARRLILATGVTDELPDIPGMEERWGKTVLHCPYCHGYEVRDRRLGIIANHPMSPHQASLIPDWGPATYFTQGRFEPDEEQSRFLDARGVTIERTPVTGLIGWAPALEGVQLADGRVLAMDALFTAPHTYQSSDLARQLGAAFEQGPTGNHLKVDEWGLTSVAGLYAAGDASTFRHNATLASASGVLAGVGAHQSLVRDVARETAHA